MNKRTEVLVVGGGVGGLATALALTKSGLSVRLLERAPEFGEVGAGLQLGPNATRVLASWGLLDDVVAVGVLPERIVLKDALTTEELVALDLGEGFRQRYHGPYVVVHRSDLHRILLDAARAAGVLLHTDTDVVEVRSDSDRAHTHAADGTQFTSDVVVGADGLNSRLRASVVADEPISSGYVAYRGTVPIDDSTEASTSDVVAWIGPNCHLVQYPLRQGAMLNQVAVFRSPAFDRGEPDWGGPDELDQAYSACADPIKTALQHLWRDRHWPMSDREPIDNWSRDRMLLVGDAAHPMLQYLAQGACQAIEDAHELAVSVSRQSTSPPITTQSWKQAIADFQEQRVPRTAKVQRTARIWGDIWHADGLTATLRNAYLREHDTTTYAYSDWLYGL